MSRVTGHIPDAPAVIDARVGLHLHPRYGAMRAAAMPLKTTNRALLWGLVNQENVGGCEGCAHASAATTQFALDGTPLDEPLSHVGLYLGALMCDAVPNSDGTLPPLLDTGTMPSSIQSGLLIYGASAVQVFGQMPMSQATMYVDPSGQRLDVPQGALIQPTPEQLYGERACRLQGAYFLQSSGAARARDVVRVLASRRVFTVAIPASGDEFQAYTGGVLGALSGDIDHANFIIDYTWTGTQSQLDAFMGGDDALVTMLQVHGCNSWGGVGCADGGDWGEVDEINGFGGQYRADYHFVEQADDWCVMDLKRIS